MQPVDYCNICSFIELIHQSLHCNPAHLSQPANGMPNHVPVAAPLRQSDEVWGAEKLEEGRSSCCISITDLMSAQVCVVTVPVTAYCQRKEEEVCGFLCYTVRVMYGGQKEREKKQ